MYSCGHEMQYTMFSDLQVKGSRMVVDLLGPHTWTLDDVSVWARAAAGMSTCGSSGTCQRCVPGHLVNRLRSR